MIYLRILVDFQISSNLLDSLHCTFFLVLFNSPSVVMSKWSFRTHEEIKFTFRAPKHALTKSAWIGIIPASISHGSEYENDKHDKGYKYLGSATMGTLTLPNPGKGSWTVRLHDTESGTTGKELAYASFFVY